MSNSIFEQVKQVMVKTLSMSESDISLSSSLKEDLGVDSLDVVELIMALEDEFDLEIQDEIAETLHTVQHIVDHIEQNTL